VFALRGRQLPRLFALRWPLRPLLKRQALLFFNILIFQEFLYRSENAASEWLWQCRGAEVPDNPQNMSRRSLDGNRSRLLARCAYGTDNHEPSNNANGLAGPSLTLANPGTQPVLPRRLFSGFRCEFPDARDYQMNQTSALRLRTSRWSSTNRFTMFLA
jgi:hypothetical protein